MEFCDRGSLKDIMKVYKKERQEAPTDKRPRLPEKFIWHCYIGLCDALAYLRSGLCFNNNNIQDPNKVAPGWIPIVHRDIKPDNILLRSRTTSGDRKYFYVTLSDFGLACDDYPSGHPKEALDQKARIVCGTPTWLAPELCHEPYAKTSEQVRYFPSPYKHSAKTDVWALSTVIFDLAECNQDAHYDFARFKDIPDSSYAITAKFLHKEPKIIKSYYSEALRKSILEGTNPDPAKRPKATELIINLTRRCKTLYPGGEPNGPDDQLPPWATRIHDYHTREPFKKPDWIEVL